MTEWGCAFFFVAHCTTFKPVAAITLARVWMEAHDRATFKQVWEELQRLVKLITARPIGFKAIHKNGTLLGLNADMEAAPVLGFGDAFLPTIDRDELRGKAVEAFKAWVVTLPDPTGELTGKGSPRELGRWNHRLRHSWLLPGAIQCLSRMLPDNCHLMEATTNLGEAQHAWNNGQTGIGMGVIESF
ncbi:hypothetical protein B0H14DRAFT_2579662 [Mycena olivaceomarginata]|nr:hypothetical protein B0H14DRAFT_2579662 [Mycena olivaceomarginata]